MILTCPACATRYRVADREFDGAAVRTVRCGNCGHMWNEAAAVAQQQSEHRKPLGQAIADLDAARDEASVEADRTPVSRLDVPPRPQPTPPSKRWRSGVIAAVLLLATAAVGWVARYHVAAVAPPSAQVSASTAGSNVPTGAGLVIRKIAPSRTGDGLTIDGEIVNLGKVAHSVPRLRVALQDAADKEIQSEIVDPPKTRLQPGEIVHFETPFAHPPDAAAGVVVTFASS